MAYFNDDEARSRQIILEHYEEPDHKVDETSINNDEYIVFNNKTASCIDNLTLYIKFDDSNNVIDAKFSGIGCAISTASTDIFCTMIIGKQKNDIISIINEYFNMIDGLEYNKEILDNLNVFKNISKQLNRIKCAKVGVVAINEIVTNK